MAKRKKEISVDIEGAGVHLKNVDLDALVKIDDGPNQLTIRKISIDGEWTKIVYSVGKPSEPQAVLIAASKDTPTESFEDALVAFCKYLNEICDYPEKAESIKAMTVTDVELADSKGEPKFAITGWRTLTRCEGSLKLKTPAGLNLSYVKAGDIAADIQVLIAEATAYLNGSRLQLSIFDEAEEKELS